MRLFRSPCAVAILLLVGGCDALPPAPEAFPRPPAVEALALAPAAAHADTLARDGALVLLPVRLTLRVRPGDAPVERVGFAVRWTLACTEDAEAAGSMARVGPDLYAGEALLRLPPGRRGAFRVAAAAVDAHGRVGGEAVATLVLHARNAGPPVIERVEAPPEVRIPAAGSAALRLRVTVSDPDGVDHVARAEVSVPGAGTFPMAQTDPQDNRTPCDGIFSATFAVPAGAEPGTLPFTFRAFDRDGAASDPVTVSVRLVR